MSVSTVVDAFANEIASSGSSSLLATCQFLSDAESEGFWSSTSKCSGSNSLTIFVPEGYRSGDATDHFDEFWRRHAVRGTVRIAGDSVQQLTTLSNLVIAVYPAAGTALDGEATHAVAGASIGSFSNIQYNGCIFHAIAAPELPDLRPAVGQVGTLKICYLAGEHIEVLFSSANIKDEDQHFTLIVSITYPDRSPIAANQKMPWQGNGTLCRVLVPDVSTNVSNAMVWFSLYDVHLRHPVMSLAFPWYLVLRPNVHMHPNPQIIDISRKRGKSNQELWIRGSGFSAIDVRVTIGAQAAQVVQCEPTLIMCYIPTGTGKHPVWVANGNVYTRYDSFTYE